MQGAIGTDESESCDSVLAKEWLDRASSGAMVAREKTSVEGRIRRSGQGGEVGARGIVTSACWRSWALLDTGTGPAA